MNHTLRFRWYHYPHTQSLILLLCICTALLTGRLDTTLYAQSNGTLSGKVIDAKTKEPLAARLVVPSMRRGAAAKADGTFSLQLPAGTYDIQASYTSYKTLKRSVVITAGQTTEIAFEMTEDLVRTAEAVVLGTRRADRTVVESPVPIDVVPAQELRQSGFTETNQMIQMVVPSFNFPRPSIADGTDALRPATIRGLGPDQTLVLINGKRRHTTALVHVNGTSGRGSTGVDMNAIPANMIDRIEVLRDGAAAQYGSDAIAGVINIILRKDEGLKASATVGQTSRNDGRVFEGSLNYGLPLPNGGSLHFGGQYRFRDSTNRTGVDIRRMMPDSIPGQPKPITDWAADDPRRINHWQGDGRTNDIGGFINGTLPISETMSAYIFGGYTYRESEAYGFFRTPNDARNIYSVYPNGFLPQIFVKLNDLSFGGGVKGDLNGWNYDVSAVYGTNSFQFIVRNSINASLGASSPREFDCGTMLYNQASFNLDLSKSFDIGAVKPLNLAFGGEFRSENYQIKAGQPESWWNQPNDVGAKAITAGPGPARDTTISGVKVPIPASASPITFVPTPVRVPITQSGSGGIPAAGAQVFPGFKPANETNVSRTNLSLYVDVETEFIERWNIGVAARFESYSDFGSLVTGKFATRYEFIPGIAVRGAFATGFRAPSLQQQYFTATSTNFINGIPFDISTFPPTSSAGVAFGAVPLKPEKSVNLSAGFTFDKVENLSISVDYYNIAVTDRITLSGNFTGDSVRALLARNGIVGSGGGRFFTNILDTRTQGLDIIVRYGFSLGEGTMRLTAAFNWNENKIDKLKDAPLPLKRLEGLPGGVPVSFNSDGTLNPSNALFDRGQVVLFEKGQPRTNLNLSANYSIGKFNAMLRTIRFGEVTVVNQIPFAQLDQETSGKFITDLDFSYEVLKGLKVAVGANNIFDVMPQEWTLWQSIAQHPSLPSDRVPYPTGVPATQGVGTNGTVFKYSALAAPWGMGGRFMYVRLSFEL